AGSPIQVTPISWEAALEETLFLGLRLNRGVDMDEVERKFGTGPVSQMQRVVDECISDGLIKRQESRINLSSRGRLLSNEVFERFISVGKDRVLSEKL
ncbi:MAG TPA: hypothetical protein VGN39_13755, partial [Terriglobales bacterium]|nr:hypothetical protein [Terriglobales bacterium]